MEAAAASASDARARHTAGVVAAAAAAADARARHTAEEAALQERARNAAAMRAAEQVAASEQAAAAVAAGSEEEPVGLMAQLVPHPPPLFSEWNAFGGISIYLGLSFRITKLSRAAD